MLSETVCVLCLIHFVILLTLTRGLAEMHELRPTASDFRRHIIVQPFVQHGRSKRDISSTRDESGAHHSEVTMTIPIDGEELILNLRLNHDLVTENHVLTYQENRQPVVRKPTKEEIDLCHYGGSVRDKPGSWVAVSTCHGIQGIVFDGHEMRYIEPAQGSDITAKHYVYGHSELAVTNKCGYEGVASNNSRYSPLLHHSDKDGRESILSRHKRRAHNTQVRAPYNANKHSRYVELVLVADNSLYQTRNRNIQTVYRDMQTLANMINSVYSQLNIFVALVNVEVWNRYNEIPLSDDAQTTLEEFLNYRRTKLLRRMPNDNAHLVTGKTFDNRIVGKAYRSTICSSKFSGGVSTEHTDVIGLQAMTIAHELGHNLGMDHDDEELCECPGHKCIMSPQSNNVTPTHWSSCSLDALALSHWKGLDYCLRNKPKRLFVSQRSSSCGNGFVEPGEQCDCGTTSDPRAYNPCHACCDPNTCRLRANATCGAGMCCDLQTCRPKSAGTVCRSADRECDLPEYCTGHSEYCPDDVYKMDTTPCEKNGQTAYCVRGGCRSHSDQCRLLWGSTGETSHNKCYYVKNVKGDQDGNCGYDQLQNRYQKCSHRDAMCGRLQCARLDKDPDLGIRLTAKNRQSYVDQDTIKQCHTATIDMGLSEVDPGMVPDGAKCGDNMMCLSQRCVSVAAVRQRIKSAKSSVCPSDCSGHGVCNSAGQCHCEPGFAPPLCAKAGPGGSYSSGPATGPNTLRIDTVMMYVIFLGVLPSILLILSLIYYFRSRVFLICTSLRNKCVYSVYLAKNKPMAKSTNIESPNSCQTPAIIYNLRHDTSNLHETNLQNKSSSVIYTNIDALKNQDHQKISVNASVGNLQNSSNSVIYANLGGNVQKTNENLHFASNNIVDLPYRNVRNSPVNVINTSDRTRRMPGNVGTESTNYLCETPVDVVNTPRDHMHKTSGSIVLSPSDSLRKTSAKVVSSPSDSFHKTPSNVVNKHRENLRNNAANVVSLPRDNLRKNSANTLRLQSGNLRKAPDTPVNVVNSPSSHLRNAPTNVIQKPSDNKNTSDSIVNVFNVKLRKTSANVTK